MAPIPQVTPVKKTPQDYSLASGYSIPDYWYEIEYNGRKLKYTLEIVGNQPPRDNSGYPLFIAMHGGGSSDNGQSNDNEWNGMYQTFYKSPLANYYSDPPTGQNWTPNGAAVYVTIRGVSTGINLAQKQTLTDDYNLHSRPEGQVLVERLIVHLLDPYPSEFNNHPRGPQYTQLLSRSIIKNFVDANRVYLLGFSAGGNGAFELGTRLSDRFAAIVPAAGHPEGASLTNLANLPTFLQVGEDDAWPYQAGNDYTFQRAQVYLANANKVLDDCQNNAKYQNRPALYPHTCDVVKNSDRTVNTRANIKVHNYWSQSPPIFSIDQQILKKEFFPTWLDKWKQQNNPMAIQGMPAEAYAPLRVTPIPRMAVQTRKTTPPLVVWDLRGRTQAPDFNDPNRVWEEQRYSYWFYLRRSMPSIDNATYQPEWAWCDRTAGKNDLHIETPNDYIAYLLEHGSMLNLNALITVYIAGSTKPPQLLRVILSDDIRKVTQAARGDTKWLFSAMIYLVRDGNAWTAKSATTMAEVGPLSFEYPKPTAIKMRAKL